MTILRDFEIPARYRGGFAAIGNFDGVHRGHQSMIAVLVNRARAAEVPAVVLTFDPHPIQLLRPGQAPPSLSTLERKAELLKRAGVDLVIAYPTDTQLLNLAPEAFFETIVREQLNAQGLVEGPNFFFGKDRAGDVETLQQLCDAAGMTLDVVPPFALGDQLVSSSVIRAAISRGKFSTAIEMLGHSYRLQGRVVRGEERGRTLGFPTANLDDVMTLLPSEGVYAGSSSVDGSNYPAAVNIGPNPTFGEQIRKIEVHIVGFSGDLYGEDFNVDLLEWMRGTVKFGGVEELKRQLANDVANAEAAFARVAECSDGNQ